MTGNNNMRVQNKDRNKQQGDNKNQHERKVISNLNGQETTTLYGVKKKINFLST
jgi:hypothetical protein